jgi:hypothetical protein
MLPPKPPPATQHHGDLRGSDNGASRAKSSTAEVFKFDDSCCWTVLWVTKDRPTIRFVKFEALNASNKALWHCCVNFTLHESHSCTLSLDVKYSSRCNIMYTSKVLFKLSLACPPWCRPSNTFMLVRPSSGTYHGKLYVLLVQNCTKPHRRGKATQRFISRFPSFVQL